MGKAAHMLALYRYAYEDPLKEVFITRKYPKFDWDWFRVAGDDFVALGPKRYLELLKNCHLILGHKVGTYIYSKRVTRYCEEPLIFQNRRTGQGKPIWECEYAEHIHVDALKVRVFSPCGKISSGPIEDFKSPVIGKGQALERKLAWLPPDWKHLEHFLIMRWCFRMSDYIDLTEPYWFLPQSLGGCGLPNPYDWADVVVGAYNRCPTYLTCTKAVLSGDVPFWLNKVLQSMSAGGISRGSELDLRQAAHEGYVMSTEISGHQKGQDDIAIEAGFSPEDFNRLSRGKRRDKARQLGYIAEFDLDTILEKAWLIKSAFQTAYRSEDVPSVKHRLHPDVIWNQLSELINSSVSRVLPAHNDREELLRLFRFLKGNIRVREKKGIFIHEDVLSRNFGALKTPLPPPPDDLTLVRGSTADIL
jgi:hypothetical protein